MGIISGFVGGVSKGLADAGKMMFADKIAKERDEANALRASELSQENQTFTASEAQKQRDFQAQQQTEKDKAAMERTKVTAGAKGGANKPTNQEKNAADLRKKGYPAAIADGVANGAIKTIKDEDTGDMVLVNALDSKPIGRLTTVGNKKKWVPEGQQPENAEITPEDRRKAKSEASDKAGWITSDKTDFPSTGGDRKAWINNRAQELANERRGGKGVVGSQMNNGQTGNQNAAPDMPQANSPQPGAASQVKKIGNRQISKQEYIDAMVKKYGPDKMAQIEQQWQQYQ